MAYFKTLDQPISTEAPCGIDIDSDPEMQAFLTMAEGALPASFRDFDRKEFDDKGNLEKIETYLARSRDLRLLVLAAKTFALTDNLDGFFECLDAAAALLEKHWEHCHPQAVEGDYALRTAYLQSFDDRPTIVMPLQAAPLIKDKRLGAIPYRAFLVARKPALARPGETVADEATLHDAFSRYEPVEDIVALRDKFRTADANLQKLRSLFIDNANYEAAPQFDLLPNFLKEVADYLSGIIAERNPLAAEAPTPASDGESREGGASESASQPAAGEIANTREAADALEAVTAYFSRMEPSSPSKLLVRQAHQLVGRSFVDAMSILAPSVADEAKVDWTGATPFSLSFAQLRDLAAADSEGVALDGDSRAFTVATRSEAVEVMKLVEMYYRRWEPSSPIPMLLDRARKFVARDFSSLLAELVQKQE